MILPVIHSIQETSLHHKCVIGFLSLFIKCGYASATSFVAEKICLTGLFQNLCINQDKSVSESSVSSSDKSASLAELIYVFIR